VACVRARNWSAEIIVVNDGSTDETAALVRDFAQDAPEVRLIENPRNLGKGYSVVTRLHASGEIVMFTDADLSSPIEEAERLLRPFPTALTSRSARVVGKQPPDPQATVYRQFFGRVSMPHARHHDPALCRYAM